jgi:hypothetical protein
MRARWIPVASEARETLPSSAHIVAQEPILALCGALKDVSGVFFYSCRMCC